MSKKFDSYLVHIEPSTVSRLNEAHGLLIESQGKHLSFDTIIRKALGRYITAIKYDAKRISQAD